MEHRITVFAGPASSQLGAAVCDTLRVSPGLYQWEQWNRCRSIAMEPPAPPHLDIYSVAPLLGTAIQRTHHDESLADLCASA